MYKTTLTKREMARLRSEGFINVTGLSYYPGRGFSGSERELYFPKKQWGKWAQDKHGFLVTVLRNGEVWIRYLDQNSKYNHDDGMRPKKVVEVMVTPTKLLNEVLGLKSVPYSSLFRSRTLTEDELTERYFLEKMYPRITNPYYGAEYSNNPDPERPRKARETNRQFKREMKNLKKQGKDPNFLDDEFLPLGKG